MTGALEPSRFTGDHFTVLTTWQLPLLCHTLPSQLLCTLPTVPVKSGDLLYKRSSALYKPVRPRSSSLVFAGPCPHPAVSGAPRLDFLMLSTADVLCVVSKEDRLMSVDLKEALYQVPIMLHRRLLCFAFQSRYSRALSIWTFPGVFTIGVTASLKSQSVRILPSWTIWLICAPYPFKATQHTARTLSHAARLGLREHKEPSQSITFIGVALDAATKRACPSLKRVDGILRSIPL